MENIQHISLAWNIDDIKLHASTQGHHPNDEQAQVLLETFFEEREEYIIEHINNLMADFCSDFYNGYDND